MQWGHCLSRMGRQRGCIWVCGDCDGNSIKIKPDQSGGSVGFA